VVQRGDHPAAGRHAAPMSIVVEHRFQCDRCGCQETKVAGIPAGVVSRPERWSGVMFCGMQLDLCPGCIQALGAWLRQYPQGPFSKREQERERALEGHLTRS
jgi:hypothetical protein